MSQVQVRPAPSRPVPPERGGEGNGTGLQVRALVRLICEANPKGMVPKKKRGDLE